MQRSVIKVSDLITLRSIKATKGYIVTTCFIFAKHGNEEDGFFSLTLNGEGNVETALAKRSVSEIKQLQSQAKTIVVASTEQFSLHRIALPWLPEKKARAAIPFALEDKLAENLDDLHFAFDKNHYEHGHYLVAVGNKSYLVDLITTLDKHDLTFDLLTLDWFALKNNESCILDSNVLVHNDLIFSGSLPLGLALNYLKDLPVDQTLYIFPDSNPLTIATQSLAAF